MTKKESYEKMVAGLLESSSVDAVMEYLRTNSNLPGPRGNLELAFGFASSMASGPPSDDRWGMLERLLDFPVNSPMSSCRSVPTWP